MKKLIARQLFFVLVSFIGISLISYSLIIVGSSYSEASQLSYFSYLVNIFYADLGTSSITSDSVYTSFVSHLPASLELVILATILALSLGIPLGVIAAKYHRSTADFIINNIAILAYSMPIFWWAIILIVYFSLDFNLTPVAGRISFIYDIEAVTGFMLIDTLLSDEVYRIEAFYNALAHLMLPVITLATLPLAIIIRITRQTMLNTIAEDYIKTAQSKGLSEFKIYWVHGLRNALIPLTNMLALQISTLMTGAMITEYIFAWPGIGKWLIDALTQADYISLSGGVLITATMVIIINAVIEIIAIWLDPRVHVKKRIYHA